MRDSAQMPAAARAMFDALQRRRHGATAAGA
jgi:hypothetical protein